MKVTHHRWVVLALCACAGANGPPCNVESTIATFSVALSFATMGDADSTSTDRGILSLSVSLCFLWRRSNDRTTWGAHSKALWKER